MTSSGLNAKENLTYFSNKKEYSLFFTDELYSKVEHLHTALPQTSISVYPDATLKTNGLPTGIACASMSKNAMLLPFILRDPGCGYLMFKLKFNNGRSPDWKQIAGNALDGLATSRSFHDIKNNLLNTFDLSSIINNGLHALSTEKIEIDLNKFIYTNFVKNEKSVLLTNNEIQLLKEDLMALTNTIEIRKLANIKMQDALRMHSIDDQDYIGFIHTGSHVFPKILGEKFVYRICEYAHQNKLFSLDDIDNGVVGVPLNSTLGTEYETWLYAAMNHALVSRYSIFLAVKQELESLLPCEITLLNDNPHAGLFQGKWESEHVAYSTRGVQHIFKQQLSVVAGQKETPAALVTGGVNVNKYNHFISHGTGYHINNQFDYSQVFCQEDQEQYLLDAHDTFYNSKPHYEDCIPYTYSLCRSLKFFEEIGLADTVAFLSPVINIQSEWLKN
ncbi:MAG: hypothetical protein A3F11_11260 [Gammaproteobacteria bacterium RIFCSPHIGHO2_12_FULL_37_14]|nr:MAG: hypothetical protein A3F11_11260 [Gammaproteobacteria bacterium RIFCSPHIGHO2_12_FULL_37_14]